MKDELKAVVRKAKAEIKANLTEEDVKRIASDLFAEMIKSLIKAELDKQVSNAVTGSSRSGLI